MTRQEIFANTPCANLWCTQTTNGERYCNFCRPAISEQMFRLLGEMKDTEATLRRINDALGGAETASDGD